MSDLFTIQFPTKVYYGDQLDDHLAEEVMKYGKRVLLVYGGRSVIANGLLDRVKGILEKAGCETFEYGGVKANPRHTQCEEAADLCREKNIEVILPLGGGSVIDAGKLIAAQRFHDGSAWDILMRKSAPDKALPIIAILTNAATGSETDGTTVINNEEKNIKRSWKSPMIFPKVAFTDPALTFSVGKYTTASGCSDIFSHALETYLAPNKGLYLLDSFLEGLMKTVRIYAPIALQEPDNYEARSNIMLASSWAINGFFRSGKPHVWPMHQIQHELSAWYDISHGHGLAIIMPRYMRYVLNEQTAGRMYQFGKTVFDIEDGLDEITGATEAIEALENWLFNELGLEAHLSGLGITDEHFEQMADSILSMSGNPLGGFVPIGRQEIIDIYRMCL